MEVRDCNRPAGFTHDCDAGGIAREGPNMIPDPFQPQDLVQGSPVPDRAIVPLVGRKGFGVLLGVEEEFLRGEKSKIVETIVERDDNHRLVLLDRLQHQIRALCAHTSIKIRLKSCLS